ncbi:hypothetical protein A3A95_01100 [Candidatus Nomurabacteria bacterium RIFCSPLOWO2_01_FULL_39_18]|uniref:Uncharacterized protein n=1 Tax=Candidatus Nomurabacteria bacterium RIFCSPHIGHO2_01_FULL_40_24b TaxID=1801739 RepID=A0A1F6V6R8_9BACT|nr:MAG: hypothetical protein A2647_02900 [Candidatus Nomurabacteria bacterium RIFCSPHIGHO2_01_FULL_40_24b]OGI89903.1 MAG: hypothetical protein A3A95_01100 [Candidatus Nomurabacteria bacterium RIFCSPLOWO2_01_FULL_39_18]
MKSETKKCQNCKKDFTIEPEDFNFYQKIKVPPPTFCPECRMQRRMAWRNERTLHRNKCAKTGKSLVSCFAADSPFTIFERDIWWGDEWDPRDYGQDYDFNKPFFAQFRELMERTPQPNLFIGKCVNTFYGNYIGEFKNSYLVSASWGGEDVYYSSRVQNSKNCMDMFTSGDCQFCYDDISSSKCYETFFSQYAEACTSSYFLYDCKNCINCFGCTNLRNKSNCMWNEQLTKEAYDKQLKELNLNSFKNLMLAKEKFENLKMKAIRRYANIIRSTNVSGDNIINSDNCQNCFDLFGEVKDCKFITNCAIKFYTSYDGYGVGANSELVYEAMDSGVDASRLLFTLTAWECLNTEYCINCHGSNNLFGCVGLRNKSYCILNKQYTKEEFLKLREEIMKHMMEMPYSDKRGNVYRYGEYFPAEISPFGYNETVARDYFPINKNDIIKNGYKYIEKEKPEYQATRMAKYLPDNIKDTDEQILKEVIECESCRRPFKIIENELIFLKRFNLALPRKCFECRHQERFKKVNPPKLYHRQCMCGGAESPRTTVEHSHSGQCTNEFETSYAPERPEIVYCEKCFQQEVY